MFNDNQTECFNISSNWKKEKKFKEIQTQTEVQTLNEAGNQYPLEDNKITQTYIFERSNQEYSVLSIDFLKLAKFIQSASEITIKEIEKSIKSKRLNQLLQHKKKIEILTVQKFTSEHLNERFKNLSQTYMISALSWNSTSSVLLVGYSFKHHENWCFHQSFICSWRIYKNFNNKPLKPNNIFELDNCISFIQSHPNQPSIFAVGTFNGKLSIWDTRNENEMQLIHVIAHRSSITGLHWTQLDENKSDYIVSSGLDGKILLWEIQNYKSLVHKKSFVILTDDLPRSLSIKGNKSNSEVGIFSMSFNTEYPSIFVVGCYGGALFQCSLTNEKTLDTFSNDENASFTSPIVRSFAPHRGHVKIVQFCQTLRNIFLSCSLDCELRVYSLLNSKPLMVIHTEKLIVNAEWSSSKLNIIILTEDGYIHIYNIYEYKNSAPFYTFSFGDKEKPIIFKGDFFTKNEQLAIGSSYQNVHVKDLSTCTNNFKYNETKDFLNKLIEDAEDE